MIRFALICEREHGFEGWFPSGAGADAQLKRGLVDCPACGSTKIEKAPMAPSVSGTRTQDARDGRASDGARATATEPEAPAPAPVPAMPPAVIEAVMADPHMAEARARMKALKDKLLANSENVGPRFAEEARKIHHGETEHRTIHGRATAEEAAALREEGIEFAPLPVLPDEMN